MSGGVRGRKFLNQRNFLLLDFILENLVNKANKGNNEYTYLD